MSKQTDDTHGAPGTGVPAPKEGIHAKLAWIQARVVSPKDRRNGTNPELEYRNIEDICAAAGPLLEEAGCAMTFTEEVVEAGGGVYIRSTATITDGKESVSCCSYAREDDALPDMCAAQVTGACTSYARKYAAAGLLAIGSGRKLAPHEEIDALDQRQAAETSHKARAGEKNPAPSPVRNPYSSKHPILMPDGSDAWNGAVAEAAGWEGTEDEFFERLQARFCLSKDAKMILLATLSKGAPRN